jgi:hypothetical protein
MAIGAEPFAIEEDEGDVRRRQGPPDQPTKLDISVDAHAHCYLPSPVRFAGLLC